LETRWDSTTRPIAKATLKQALEERRTPEAAEQSLPPGLPSPIDAIN